MQDTTPALPEREAAALETAKKMRDRAAQIGSLY
jgi:hypothetical protein